MLQNTIETLNYVLFLLPGETSTARTVYVGVLRLGNFAFAMETQHTDAVSIAKTSKVKNGTHLFFLPRIKKVFCAICKEGTTDKRSYSGGRLLKSLGRHRIVQKPMQEKQRTIDLSSCKSYIWKKKGKKSSYLTNDTACSQEAIWLVYFRHTLDAQ